MAIYKDEQKRIRIEAEKKAEEARMAREKAEAERKEKGEAERVRREEKQREEAAQALVANKRKKKIYGIVAAVVVACVAVVIVVTKAIIRHDAGSLSNAEIGQIITFGAYEQDNDTSNGKEDIEWIVLAKEEDRILVISKYALDCQQYHTSWADVTWETCTLRTWLNETFLSTAFTAAEQMYIPTVTVTADENPEQSTNAGNDTQDQVFLLSIPEVQKYFTSDEDRKAAPTAYAEAQGALTLEYETVDGKASCCCWLRSPGSSSKCAALVFIDGSVLFGGNYVDDVFFCVRPALWIDLAS